MVMIKVNFRFDVYFPGAQVPVKLSTSPYSTSTHWKQAVFYVNEPFLVDNGDTIEGSIAVKKSDNNPRDLDIKISVHLQNKGIH
jgi:hypothetical protein